MVEKRLTHVAFWTMGVLALLVSLSSLRYFGVLDDLWLGVDPKLKALIEAHPFEALSHMLVAPMALVLGPWQFLPGLRARHLQLHRWLGRLYVAACTTAGIGGFLTALHATGGPVAGFGFALLAVLWVGTTLAAWRAAMGARHSSSSPHDALQLCHDIWGRDASATDPAGSGTRLSRLSRHVGVAGLYVLDPEPDGRRAVHMVDHGADEGTRSCSGFARRAPLTPSWPVSHGIAPRPSSWLRTPWRPAPARLLEGDHPALRIRTTHPTIG